MIMCALLCKKKGKMILYFLKNIIDDYIWVY